MLGFYTWAETRGSKILTIDGYLHRFYTTSFWTEIWIRGFTVRMWRLSVVLCA